MAQNFLTSQVSDASLGQDLQLVPEDTGGDFLQSEDFDIAVIQGYDNLKSSLLRRILTPLGSIKTFVYDTTGLLITDQNYGNGAYKYLSEPLSETLITRIKEELTTCLMQETRIQLQTIDAGIAPLRGAYQVTYNINYSVVGSNDMEVLSIIQAGNSLLTK